MLLALLLAGCSGAIGDAAGGGPDAGTGQPPTSSAPDAGPDIPGERADAGPNPTPAGDYQPSNIPPNLAGTATAALVLEANDSPIVIDTDTGAITRSIDAYDLRPDGLVYMRVAQGAGLPDSGRVRRHLDHAAVPGRGADRGRRRAGAGVRG